MAKDFLTQKNKPVQIQNIQLEEVNIPPLNDAELSQVSRIVFPSDSDDRTETTIKPNSPEEQRLADFLVQRNTEIVKQAKEEASEDRFVEE